jgi:hypothetical protein
MDGAPQPGCPVLFGPGMLSGSDSAPLQEG